MYADNPKLWRFRPFIGAVLAVTAAYSYADTVRLRDEVYVKGPTVTLGDVALIEGENAEMLATIEVVAAPSPGNSARVDAALVRTRIERAGFDPEAVEVLGARRVVATRLHLEITRDMIAEDLRHFVESRMPWDLEDAVIEVSPPPKGFVVPDGNVEFHWQPDPRYAYLGPGVFRGEVLVDGKVEQRFVGRATIDAFAGVVVAATDIARGETVSRHNLRLEKRALATLDPGAYFSLAEVEGHVAKSSLFGGQVVTARRVAPPVLVRRRQVVLVETSVGSVVARGRALVLHDAGAGEVVTCQVLNSKDQFQGVLRGDGVVEVR